MVDRAVAATRLLGNDVKRLAERIGDRRVLAWRQGYLRRTIYDGGGSGC